MGASRKLKITITIAIAVAIAITIKESIWILRGISSELRTFNLTTFKGIINGVMKYKGLNLHVMRIYFLYKFM